jgi:hypothetical protein
MLWRTPSNRQLLASSVDVDVAASTMIEPGSIGFYGPHILDILNSLQGQHQCQDVEGFWPLEAIDAEGVLMEARERWADHPALERLAYDAASVFRSVAAGTRFRFRPSKTSMPMRSRFPENPWSRLIETTP